MSDVTVGDVARAIDDRFPGARAEKWDRIGLLAGDPGAVVTGVMCALDPTRAAIAAAVESGCNVLLTHHPAFIDPLDGAVAGAGSAGVVFAAVSQGVALINAHTNLDRDPAAQRLLPAALGLEWVRGLETSPQPMALITVYVPRDARETVEDAMVRAGAGRIGDYDGCSFASSGEGRFDPRSGATPAVGEAQGPTSTPEDRLEMVAPVDRSAAVVDAAAAAHPYEEPLVTSSVVRIARNAARLGMVSKAPSGMALRGLAAVAGAAFGVVARVWGDPDMALDLVATTTGSGTSMLHAARAAGAGALVLGEVRYHDALDAAENGLAIVEIGHDVSEWPLVTLLEQTAASVPGLGHDMVRSMAPRSSWWTV